MKKSTIAFGALALLIAVGSGVYIAHSSQVESDVAAIKAPVTTAQAGKTPNGPQFFDAIASNPKPVDTRTAINGIKVPPMPDMVQNNRDVAGIDSDRNGIRDDVDRFIAEQFGNDPKMYQIAARDAKAMQSVLVDPSRQNIDEFHTSMDCLTFHQIGALDKVQRIVPNSPARGKIFAATFAGDSWRSRHDCPNQAEIDASYMAKR